jgi:tetratricopeptide (TPR) repeat protein
VVLFCFVGIAILNGRSLISTTPSTPTGIPEIGVTELSGTLDQGLTISLNDALVYLGLVEGSIRGMGPESRNGVILTVRRAIASNITIGVLRGSLLKNTINAETDMIVYRLKGVLVEDGQIQPADTIQLLDDEWHEYVLEAYSIDFGKSEASPNATFTLIDSQPSEVLQILDAADATKVVSPDQIQIAIWAITDGVNEDDLRSKERYYGAHDLNVIKSLLSTAGLNPSQKRLFDRTPFTAQAYVTRATSYVEIGEYIQAVADYSVAIKLQPDNTEALYQRGLIYAQLQRYEEAIRDLKLATRLAPEHPQGFVALGRAYYFKSEPDYSAALANLTSAIKLDSSYAEAYYLRGLVHAAMSNLGSALKDFDTAIQREPGFAEAYYSRGLVYASEQDLDRAIADFSRAIQQNTLYTDAYLARGAAYDLKEDYSKAIADYNEVISQAPDFADAYRARGMSFRAKGEFDLAVQDFLNYLELNPYAQDGQEIADLIASLRQPLATPGVDAIPLPEAQSRGLIQAELFGLGVASGDSIQLKVRRIISREVESTLPQGTLLISDQTSNQDMVVRQISGIALSTSELQPMSFIHLTNDKSQTYYVEAYSLRFEEASPNITTTFSVAGYATSDVLAILAAADKAFGAGGDIVSIQAAIWALTDDVGWIDLAERGYYPNLQLVQALYGTAELDPRCYRLFGGTPCSPTTP